MDGIFPLRAAALFQTRPAREAARLLGYLLRKEGSQPFVRKFEDSRRDSKWKCPTVVWIVWQPGGQLFRGKKKASLVTPGTH